MHDFGKKTFAGGRLPFMSERLKPHNSSFDNPYGLFSLLARLLALGLKPELSGEFISAWIRK